MADPAVYRDQDPDDWEFRRYRVEMHSVLGESTVYGVYTRCGEYKAVAIAIRNHLLGEHGFFEDFPLAIEVERIEGEFTAADLAKMEASDLGDLNEG